MIFHITRSSDGLITGSIEWTEQDHMLNHPDQVVATGLKALATLTRILQVPCAPGVGESAPLVPEPPVSPRSAPVKTLANGATVTTAPRPVESWSGRTLYSWAKHQNGALDWLIRFGREHGFPKHILGWSKAMCTLAHAAYKNDRSVA